MWVLSFWSWIVVYTLKHSYRQSIIVFDSMIRINCLSVDGKSVSPLPFAIFFFVAGQAIICCFFVVFIGVDMLKVQPFRSKKYREYVSSLPCCVTGERGGVNDPHHIKGRGYGSSTKCSDLFCIPMAHALHNEFHQIGWKSFEQKHNICQITVVLKTIDQAFADGALCEP